MHRPFPDELAGEEYVIFHEAFPEYLELQRGIIPLLRRFAASRGKDSLSVLDIGSGTGSTIELILEADPRFHIDGVEHSEKMLTVARRMLAGQEARVTLNHDDALAYLQETEKSYDACVSGGMLHNFPRWVRQQYFTAINRVLEPGGLLLLADKIAPDDEESFRLAYDLDLALLRERMVGMGHEELYHEWERHYEKDALPSIIMREGEAIADLRAAGFQRVWSPERKYYLAILSAEKPRPQNIVPSRGQ